MPRKNQQSNKEKKSEQVDSCNKNSQSIESSIVTKITSHVEEKPQNEKNVCRKVSAVFENVQFGDNNSLQDVKEQKINESGKSVTDEPVQKKTIIKSTLFTDKPDENPTSITSKTNKLSEIVIVKPEENFINMEKEISMKQQQPPVFTKDLQKSNEMKNLNDDVKSPENDKKTGISQKEKEESKTENVSKPSKEDRKEDKDKGKSNDEKKIEDKNDGDSSKTVQPEKSPDKKQSNDKINKNKNVPKKGDDESKKTSQKIKETEIDKVKPENSEKEKTHSQKDILTEKLEEKPEEKTAEQKIENVKTNSKIEKKEKSEPKSKNNNIQEGNNDVNQMRTNHPDHQEKAKTKGKNAKKSTSEGNDKLIPPENINPKDSVAEITTSDSDKAKDKSVKNLPNGKKNSDKKQDNDNSVNVQQGDKNKKSKKENSQGLAVTQNIGKGDVKVNKDVSNNELNATENKKPSEPNMPSIEKMETTKKKKEKKNKMQDDKSKSNDVIVNNLSQVKPKEKIKNDSSDKGDENKKGNKNDSTDKNKKVPEIKTSEKIKNEQNKMNNVVSSDNSQKARSDSKNGEPIKEEQGETKKSRRHKKKQRKHSESTVTDVSTEKTENIKESNKKEEVTKQQNEEPQKSEKDATPKVMINDSVNLMPENKIPHERTTSRKKEKTRVKNSDIKSSGSFLTVNYGTEKSRSRSRSRSTNIIKVSVRGDLIPQAELDKIEQKSEERKSKAMKKEEEKKNKKKLKKLQSENAVIDDVIVEDENDKKKIIQDDKTLEKTKLKSKENKMDEKKPNSENDLKSTEGKGSDKNKKEPEKDVPSLTKTTQVKVETDQKTDNNNDKVIIKTLEENDSSKKKETNQSKIETPIPSSDAILIKTNEKNKGKNVGETIDKNEKNDKDAQKSNVKTEKSDKDKTKELNLQKEEITTAKSPSTMPKQEKNELTKKVDDKEQVKGQNVDINKPESGEKDNLSESKFDKDNTPSKIKSEPRFSTGDGKSDNVSQVGEGKQKEQENEKNETKKSKKNKKEKQSDNKPTVDATPAEKENNNSLGKNEPIESGELAKNVIDPQNVKPSDNQKEKKINITTELFKEHESVKSEQERPATTETKDKIVDLNKDVAPEKLKNKSQKDKSHESVLDFISNEKEKIMKENLPVAKSNENVITMKSNEKETKKNERHDVKLEKEKEKINDESNMSKNDKSELSKSNENVTSTDKKENVPVSVDKSDETIGKKSNLKASDDKNKVREHDAEKTKTASEKKKEAENIKTPELGKIDKVDTSEKKPLKEKDGGDETPGKNLSDEKAEKINNVVQDKKEEKSGEKSHVEPKKLPSKEKEQNLHESMEKNEKLKKSSNNNNNKEVKSSPEVTTVEPQKKSFSEEEKLLKANEKNEKPTNVIQNTKPEKIQEQKEKVLESPKQESQSFIKSEINEREKMAENNNKEELPEKQPDKKPEKIPSETVPAKQSDKKPEKLPSETVSEKQSDKKPEKLPSETVLEKLPLETVPEKQSDKKPEKLPSETVPAKQSDKKPSSENLENAKDKKVKSPKIESDDKVVPPNLVEKSNVPPQNNNDNKTMSDKTMAKEMKPLDKDSKDSEVMIPVKSIEEISKSDKVKDKKPSDEPKIPISDTKSKSDVKEEKGDDKNDEKKDFSKLHKNSSAEFYEELKVSPEIKWTQSEKALTVRNIVNKINIIKTEEKDGKQPPKPDAKESGVISKKVSEKIIDSTTSENNLTKSSETELDQVQQQQDKKDENSGAVDEKPVGSVEPIERRISVSEMIKKLETDKGSGNAQGQEKPGDGEIAVDVIFGSVKERHRGTRKTIDLKPTDGDNSQMKIDDADIENQLKSNNLEFDSELYSKIWPEYVLYKDHERIWEERKASSAKTKDQKPDDEGGKEKIEPPSTPPTKTLLPNNDTKNLKPSTVELSLEKPKVQPIPTIELSSDAPVIKVDEVFLEKTEKVEETTQPLLDVPNRRRGRSRSRSKSRTKNEQNSLSTLAPDSRRSRSRSRSRSDIIKVSAQPEKNVKQMQNPVSSSLKIDNKTQENLKPENVDDKLKFSEDKPSLEKEMKKSEKKTNDITQPKNSESVSKDTKSMTPLLSVQPPEKESIKDKENLKENDSRGSRENVSGKKCDDEKSKKISPVELDKKKISSDKNVDGSNVETNVAKKENDSLVSKNTGNDSPKAEKVELPVSKEPNKQKDSDCKKSENVLQVVTSGKQPTDDAIDKKSDDVHQDLQSPPRKNQHWVTALSSNLILDESFWPNKWQYDDAENYHRVLREKKKQSVEEKRDTPKDSNVQKFSHPLPGGLGSWSSETTYLSKNPQLTNVSTRNDKSNLLDKKKKNKQLSREEELNDSVKYTRFKETSEGSTLATVAKVGAVCIIGASLWMVFGKLRTAL
ncbi:conserved hypothetical protein [Pediculus humanus corporis]|uniref:Uncharacterized protein n=1 Tax=Pediculus humanus subsp. corporis TaxID=121224 RepID=E0VNW7_PEDHC|nr:uncharacterized protein Phum_PHUM347090 [Pediculus humanus corporis]EEB15073.1 conserved hypothetical protein [Pediculus humanus corporis]